MRFRFLLCILAVLLLLIPAAGAQDSAPLIEPTDADMVNPDANISYPPPVYVVSGSVDVRGTANLEGLRNLYIEFRPLALSAMDMEEEGSQWFPATLPRIAAVVDDVLGAWNTVPLDDGLYELRLMVNTGDGSQPVARVSPIRIDNSSPEMAAMPAEMPDDMPEPATEEMAMTDDMEDMAEEPADDMAEEPVDEMPQYDGPYVVITVPGANVRRGDSTSYAVIGTLLEGNTAPIKGISSWNTGWLYIEMPNGRSGFIHPNIVRVEGDTSDVAAVQPPPLPPTPIPTAIPQPTAPPAPVTGPNLIVDGSPIVSPHPATCNQSYNIRVRVKNIGTARAGGGLVEIVDTRHDGAGRVATRAAFRETDPGQTAIAEGNITTGVYFDELHHINVFVDVDNRVQEMNEGDNRSAAAPYILQKGGC